MRNATAFASSLLLLLSLSAAWAPAQEEETPAPEKPAAESAPEETPEDAAPKKEDGPVVAWFFGTVHPVAAAPIRDAVMLVRKGRILALGPRAEVTVPDFAERREHPEAHVLPGFVHAASLAFTGKSQLSATGTTLSGDKTMASSLAPSRKESDAIARSGFTTLAVLPTGGGIVGQGAIVRPAPKGEEDAVPGTPDVLRADGAILSMAFSPRTSTKEFWSQTLEKARKYITDLAAWKKAGGKAAAKKEAKPEKAAEKKEGESAKAEKPAAEEKKEAEEKKDEAGKEKQEAKPEEKKKEEAKGPKEPAKDAKLMPLVELLEGRRRGMLLVTSAAAFAHFEPFFEKEEAFRPALLFSRSAPASSRGRGGPPRTRRNSNRSVQAWRFVDEIAALKVPVIMETLLETVPETATVLVPPRRFLDAGVPVALVPEGSGDDGFPGFRFLLGELVRHGVAEDQVLRAVTLTPAEILGIQADCGSLEVGKRADLQIFDGDPLAPTTRRVMTVVEGTAVYVAKKDPS